MSVESAVAVFLCFFVSFVVVQAIRLAFGINQGTIAEALGKWAVNRVWKS